MTYLTWGCDLLAGECQSCLDALCNACDAESRKKSGTGEESGGPDGSWHEPDEPDCDRCDLEKKPDCARCEIILAVCRDCGGNERCEFRICPDERS